MPGLDAIETASRDELAALQTERLRWSLHHAYAHVPHYRSAFAAAGVHPDDFRVPADIAKFPVTTKQHLRDAYPFGMFAVPREAIRRLHASSGTTGSATVVGYTQGDLDVWADLVARSIFAAGGRAGMTVHVAYGYGLFTGGLGAHAGAERLGCAVVPVSGGMTPRQTQLIRDLRPDILMATPSYALVVMDEFRAQGFDPRETSLRTALCGAEPWSEGMRAELEQGFGMDALDLYGLSEVLGPGVACECVETKDGPHIWEDHFYPEIIDPETGAVLPDGTPGELVLTTMTRQAMPMIRYRTRDLSCLLPGTSRSMRRMARIAGRSDDMIVLRGVNVFPSQIEELLFRDGRLAPHYLIELRRDDRLDRMILHVETRTGAAGDPAPGEALRHAIKQTLGVSVEISIAEPGAIERSAGKARRVRDLRTMPAMTQSFAAASAEFSPRWLAASETLARLPRKPERSPAEAEQATRLLAEARAQREIFLSAHATALYRALTADLTRFVRIEQLAYDAATLVPGLVPTRAQVAAEAQHRQADKDGLEIDQGLLLAHILADPACGRHLCHAMLLPRADSEALLPQLLRDGTVELPTASVRRLGNATLVLTRNPRFLNAEDEATLDDLEAAVDLAILDPATASCVLRGDAVAHPRHAGRHVFSAGINLTHLYHGKISFLWYLRRDLGALHKMFRGLAVPETPPDEWRGTTREKPWIAAVDAFAIGGGCQILLVMDYVLAARGATMTLPARKEGIIPGAANLRLPRFTGERIARQLISYGRGLDCDSPEGRLICDEIAEPDAMDAAIANVVDTLTNSGAVSLVGNRRALRIGAEPLDAFRRYMAVYAREQAICHFSPQLIANLERNWRAQQRQP